MNQQIKQLQEARSRLNKARGLVESAMLIMERSRADTGLIDKTKRVIGTIQRANLHVQQQCHRIERKIDREAANEPVFIGWDVGSTDEDGLVRAIKLLDGTLQVGAIEYTPRTLHLKS